MSESLSESVNRSYRQMEWYTQYNEYAASRESSNSPSTVAWTESRSGIQNPRWRDEVKHLQEAGTAYTRNGAMTFSPGIFNFRLFVPKFYGYTVPNSYTETLDKIWLDIPSSTGTPSPQAYNTALGNFLVNINGALSPFKGMTFLGELRETLKMLRRPASSLRDGLCSYLKRAHRHKSLTKGKSKAKLRKILADAWLEYTYGWRPLMGDIEDATKAYLSFVDRKEALFVRGESLGGDPSVSETSFPFHYNYVHMIKYSKSIYQDKVRFKGEVVHQFNLTAEENAQRVLELSGFRLGEFIPTIWELVPYSFVVDYFTNIGDILNSLSALTADLRWKSCSRWTSCTVESGIRANEQRIKSSLPTAQISVGGRPSKAQRMNYSRWVPTLTVPSLTLNLPSSQWSWANLAALLASKS